MYPHGVQKRSKEYGKVFVCRRGCNPRTATYTPEFVWEDIWKGRDTNISLLGEVIRKGTKPTKKTKSLVPSQADGRRKRTRNEEEDVDVEWDKELSAEELEELDDRNFSRRSKTPRTPSKKRRTSALSTPTRRTPGSASKKYTPTHKRSELSFLNL